MSLVYYSRERRRHQDLVAMRLTFVEARRITKMLAKEHEVPLASVVRVHGMRRRASYNPVHNRIVYSDSWVNLLTVIHEFAHGLDWKLHRGLLRGRRWHGAKHAELVDDLARVARARGWVERVPAPPRPRIHLPLNMPRMTGRA